MFYYVNKLFDTRHSREGKASLEHIIMKYLEKIAHPQN